MNNMNNGNFGNMFQVDPYEENRSGCTECMLSEKRKNCCCKKSMTRALKLLCDTELSEIIDFDKFAFLASNFLVGTKLVSQKKCPDGKDNLGELKGSFKRFEACNCDLIEIAGKAFYNIPLPSSGKGLREQGSELIETIIHVLETQKGGLAAKEDTLKEFSKIFQSSSGIEKILEIILEFLEKYFTALPMVEMASLCGIESVAFEAKSGEYSACSEKWDKGLAEKNYKDVKRILRKKLDRVSGEGCENEECHCKCQCDDCCCTEGILDEIFDSNFSRRGTLTAGNLVLKEVDILGSEGDVLVFANDEKKRFYFVCANAVQFLK